MLPVNFLTTSVCTGRLTITFVVTEAFISPESFKDGLIKREIAGAETEWLLDVAALRYENT